MADHCDTCYCSAPKLYCGVKKKLFVKISMGLASISFIGMGLTMVAHFARNQFEGWSMMEIVTFLSCLTSFTTTVLIILYVEMALFGEFLWLILCGVYEYFWDFLYYIRDHVRIVTWPCILISRMGALVGVHPQQEVSPSESESDDEKPPLPPKSRNITEAARSIPFQMVRPQSGQESSSSSSQSNDKDVESQFLGMTHTGKETASSSEKTGRRGKMSQKERFRKMMESLANMSSIEEEESSSPEAARINIPLSVLTESPEPSTASEQSTSFTESPPNEMKETKTSRTTKIRETYKQITGLHTSSKTTGTRGKQRKLKQSSVSNVRVYGSLTKQSFGSNETESEQSLEQASTSRYVPASMLLCHPSPSQLDEGQRLQIARQQASFSDSSSPKIQSKTFDTQRDRGQKSPSYVGHSELEKQSREHGVVETRREQNITEQPQSSIYVKFAVPQRIPEDQTPKSGFSGSLRRTQATSIEKIHGSPDQSSMSYVSLSELENQSQEFDTRGTKRKQISPEQPSTSRFVRTLTSPNEADENTFRSSLREARSSDFGRVQLNEAKASTSYEGLASIKKQPSEYSSVGTGTEQSSPDHRQPLSSYVKFSAALSQATEQSATTEFSSSESQIQVHDIESKQESPVQSSSYVALQVLEQQSGKSNPKKTEKKEIYPEQPSTSRYVPVSMAREQSTITEFSSSESQMKASDFENKGNPGQSPASYVALQVLEQQSGKSVPRRAEKQEISPEHPSALNYVPVSVLQDQACSVGESKQIPAIREYASETGMLTLQKESEREKKLKTFEQASVAGFHGVTSQTGESKKSPKLISSGYVPVQRVTEKSGSGAIPKRQERQRETLSSISVRPYPVSKTGGVEKKGSIVERTSGLSTHGRMERTPSIQKTHNIEESSKSYVPHSALRFGPALTQETERINPKTGKERVQDQRIQRSTKDSPERKIKIQKESFLSLNLGTGGLVINKMKLEEDETILSSTMGPCQPTFVYDQPTDVLDLSHIEIPLPKNDEESKNEDEG